MISVTLYEKEGNLKGFQVRGHSGFARKGKDIICAAVSSLVITTVNALEKFTDDEKLIFVSEDGAVIIVKFRSFPGHDAKLLMNSMVMGLKEISEENGFVKISVKEEKSHD